MRILIIEDDELKYQHLRRFIEELIPDSSFCWKKSYQSGLNEILSTFYDLTILDMSMHIYEKTAQEYGGTFETYAGRMILSEIELNEISTKVIVVTGYDVYGDGKTLDTLQKELRDEFGDFYIDTVYFLGSDDRWKIKISQLIKSNYPNEIKKQQNENVISILLVEDNQHKIDKIKKAIANIAPNSLVSEAKDLINAKEYLKKEKFDLLLLDMQLPNRYGESDLIKDAGEMLLDELCFVEDYFPPTQIVVLTQYEESQKYIRERYPERGVIKFDPSSDLWEASLHRTLITLLKSKALGNKIVYCEGQNAKHYNSLNINGIEFWGLTDSRAVYHAAKNEKDKFALRDRDFLTTNEINILSKKPFLENYFILEYYCFENYLYHPENIQEAYPTFNKNEYIEELVRQKKMKFNAIIQDYKISRLGYTDFNDNDKRNMDKNPEDEIVKSLESDELEMFYKFFDMAGKNDAKHKKSFDKSYLSWFNLNVENLLKTSWFKNRIMNILSKIL